MSPHDIPAGVRVTYSKQHRRCGKAGCSRCGPGQAGHGPYWYAFWWEGGRRRSCYLGKRAPPDAGLEAGEADDSPAGVPGASAVTALRVRTLGGFTVWRGEAALRPEQWHSRRAAALFKCLLGAPGYRLHREQATELLWPEASPATSATNLRTTVHLLRQVLDSPGASESHLRTEGAMLALAPSGAAAPAEDWLDATLFAHAARAAVATQDVLACRAALALYGGDYLPDDPYEAWASRPREALRAQYVQVLLHLAALCENRGEVEEAAERLRQCLAVEPGHEEAAAALMDLLAASGRRGEALRVYQTLATALEDDLDVAPAPMVQALRARLLAQEAAPLAVKPTAPVPRPAHPTNLPASPTSFVGRAWEMAEVRTALTMSRLHTLTGPGGCGKTRLALEVAATLSGTYPDGVWLVELAALADPALAARAVAAVLGVREEPGRSMLATLRDALAPRHVLLVLDNCEHLVEACARLAATLLAGCPHLRVLATSRERLAVDGESTYRVPSLAVPDPDHLPPLEGLPTYEAVRLFLERARERCPDFTLTSANAGAVAQICARLDGLPLAIELAAARVSALPPEGIAGWLDDRFRLLIGGPRTALPRQQTLRATVEWSYDLLDEPERLLLRRLAVFHGGCTLDAVRPVCCWAADSAAEAPQRLAALVEKSLLRRDDADAARFGLLETIRTYALERLEASGEADEARERHAAYCLALAEEAAQELKGPRQAAWLVRLEREHDNLRAALAWYLRGAEVEHGVSLAGALWRFWELHGHLNEGRTWLEQALAQSDGAPIPLRARALFGAGMLAYRQGDLEQATTRHEHSAALYREIGDTAGIANSLSTLGLVATEQGNWARAVALHQECLALRRGTGDKQAIAASLNNLANVAQEQLDYPRAIALHEESLALKREVGTTQSIAISLNNLANVVYIQRDYARARTLYEESLAFYREAGDKWGCALALSNLGEVVHMQGDHARAAALHTEALILGREVGAKRPIISSLRGLAAVELAQGDDARAKQLYEEGLAMCRDLGDTVRTALYLGGLAMVARARGQWEHAARLCGAATALLEVTGTPMPPVEQSAYDEVLAAAKTTLGEDACAAAWTAGRALSFEQAVAAALSPYTPPAVGDDDSYRADEAQVPR